MDNFDVAVLGAGPGGYVAALRAALRGGKVCCIESGKVGGACLNVGCIPTKAMLHASELSWSIRRAGEFGLTVQPARVDGEALMARVGSVVSSLVKGVEFLLKARKVQLVRGRGRLLAPDMISVQTDSGEQQVKARSVIIATGSRPARPAFLPWDSGKVLTTDEATTAPALPESVLIIGGGIIGCEFATFYSELGIPVTVVEMLDRLAANIDQDASKAVAKSLQARGVRIVTGAKVQAVVSTASGVAAELEGGTVEAACALSAVGRAPNIDDIGLEALGVRIEGKVIAVDERCRTSVPGLYAVGDVAEARQYAHIASRMGVVAADNATGHEAADSRDVVPTGVYTHPEVATVGLAEAEALRRHPAARVSRFPYLASGMARAYGQPEGLVKLIAAETGALLGGVVIGPHATDVIHEIALAMRHGLSVAQIAETIHAHPTFAEAVGESAELWLGLPLHVVK